MALSSAQITTICNNHGAIMSALSALLYRVVTFREQPDSRATLLAAQGSDVNSDALEMGYALFGEAQA